MIKAINVSKAYGIKPVIKNVSLELKEGSIYGLMGANGAGKTTLIKLLCGAYRPDEGEITLFNENISENFKTRQHIGYVPDYITFYKNFTVKDMKEFYKGVYPNFSEERYEKLRNIFNFSEKKTIKTLSKGMKTQVSLLMAFSVMPKVILMDEPTSGLDPIIRKKVLNLIVQDVAARNTSILISTHNISELEQICDTVGFMDNGEIKESFDMEDLKKNYKKVQLAFSDNNVEEFENEYKELISNKYGRVYEVIINMNLELFKKLISKYKPILVEEMDMTLEEIFIYKMGGLKDDKKIII